MTKKQNKKKQANKNIQTIQHTNNKTGNKHHYQQKLKDKILLVC